MKKQIRAIGENYFEGGTPMASNYTENYGLCQWEATDAVLRTDFNEDNAKIDEALNTLSISSAGVYNLAHNVYSLSMKDYSTTHYHGYRRGLIMDDFHNQEAIASLTGGLVVQGGALVLSGKGKKGTMTGISQSAGCSTWRRVVAWVKYLPSATYTLKVNSVPLIMTDRWDTQSTDGISCREGQYEGDIAGQNSATITLILETDTASEAKVYEYGVMFF